MPISYEKIKARKEIDPEYAAKQKSYSVAYKERNLEKERARQRLVKQRARDKDRDGYNAKMREYNKENVYPKQALEAEKRKKNNPDYKERAHTIRHLSQSDYWRHWKMKSKYGIGLFDYRKIYKNQSGKCAICNDEKSDYGKHGLVIDHCHSKGHIRELLCGKCNKGLGHFNDDINRLTNAIEYLIKHTKE